MKNTRKTRPGRSAASKSSSARKRRTSADKTAHARSNPEFTVLIVEDDDTTRRTLRQFFERRSCRVVECSSGAEGIFVYLQNPNVDVVVLDLKLPFLTGFSFIEVVQELSRLGRIPTKRNIIVNSAYLQYDDLEKLARYSTVLAIRRKPFNPHLFERDLERIRDKANLAAVLRGG